MDRRTLLAAMCLMTLAIALGSCGTQDAASVFAADSASVSRSMSIAAVKEVTAKRESARDGTAFSRSVMTGRVASFGPGFIDLDGNDLKELLRSMNIPEAPSTDTYKMAIINEGGEQVRMLAAVIERDVYIIVVDRQKRNP